MELWYIPYQSWIIQDLYHQPYIRKGEGGVGFYGVYGFVEGCMAMGRIWRCEQNPNS